MINNINIDKYRQMFSLDKENILDNYENRVSMIKRRKEKNRLENSQSAVHFAYRRVK